MEPVENFRKGWLKRLDFSGVILLVANMLPLIGVLAWGWSVFDIVAIYWFENVVLGVINVLKMLCCNPGAEAFNGRGQYAGTKVEPSGTGCMVHGTKLFFVPFFTVHYGIFCLVHGLFVFSLLGGEKIETGNPFEVMPDMLSAIFTSGKWIVGALVLSHLISFVWNFFYKGEYRKMNPPALMIAPYGRIVVLHVAILLGAFAIEALGSPMFLLVILVFGKTAIDYKAHNWSHRKAQSE